MSRLKAGNLFHERFSIREELGAGGMGVVYHAVQLDINRDVALKILNLERINQAGEPERFLREFQILSKLSHPHIMSFYMLGMSGEGIPYAVCEYLEGKSLQALLADEGKLHWRRAVKIALQIVDALIFANSHDVIHRDLKPANVMIMQKPEPDHVKLIDFGLARIVEDASLQKLTFTGQLVGTVHYMSPEQCQGRPVTAACDVYALACLLFEAISAEKLFDAETSIAVIHMQANSTVAPRLQTLQNLAPAELIALLAAMLSKVPEERPSLPELRDVLQTLSLSSDSTASGGIWIPESAGPQTAKGHLLLSVLAVLALALVTLASFVYYQKAKQNSSGIDLLKKPARNLQTPHNIETLMKMAESLRKAHQFKEERQLLLSWWNRYKSVKEKRDLLEASEPLRRLSVIENEVGHNDESDKFIAAALALCAQSTESAETKNTIQAEILVEQGGNLLGRGDHAAARTALTLASNLLLKTEIQPWSLRCANEAASHIARLQEYQLALKVQKKTLEESASFTDEREKAEMTCRLGDLSLCLQDSKTALKYYLACAEMLEDFFKDDHFPDSNDHSGRLSLPGKPLSFNGSLLWANKELTGPSLAYVGERLAFFDLERARSALKEAVTATQKEAEVGMRVDWNTWAYLNEQATELGLEEEAEKCMENALASSLMKNSSICNDQTRLFLLKSHLMRNLAYSGKAEEASRRFSDDVFGFESIKPVGPPVLALRESQYLAQVCFSQNQKKNGESLANNAKKRLEANMARAHPVNFAMQALLESYLSASGLRTENLLDEAVLRLKTRNYKSNDEYIATARALLELGKSDLLRRLLSADLIDGGYKENKVPILLEWTKRKIAHAEPQQARKLAEEALKLALTYEPQFGWHLHDSLAARLYLLNVNALKESKFVPGLQGTGKALRAVYWTN